MTASASVSEIEELEALGHRTWPALEDDVVCGWRVRAADGLTRRSNSVNPIGPPTCPTDEAIEAATDWLAARGQPPVFRLVPSSPNDLEAQLIDRGLVRHEGATIMTAEIDAPVDDPGVGITSLRSTEWTDLLVDPRDESRATVEQVLDTHRLSTLYGLIRIDGQVVAIGMAVVDGRDAALFNMRTHDDSLRQGLGTRMLRAILGAAFEMGARRGFLQVMPSNTAAVGLYNANGFVPRYDYAYLQEPTD